MSGYILYDFPRASSAYRVRIALALKGIDFEAKTVDFRQSEQQGERYRHVNPAALVPTLVTPEGASLTQSLAIIAYLDRLGPAELFPLEPTDRAHVEAMALTIACDVHPLNNLRVLNYLESELNCDEVTRSNWYAEWVLRGFEALEVAVQRHGGLYCFGDRISVADICLVPQMFNARRFAVPLDRFPELIARDERLQEVPEFRAAKPV